MGPEQPILNQTTRAEQKRMEQLLIELLKSSPIGAGIITIVWIFIQHLDKRDAMFRESLREQHDGFRQDLADRDKFISSLGDQCHAVQREALQAIRDNTVQHVRTAEAIRTFLENEQTRTPRPGT